MARNCGLQLTAMRRFVTGSLLLFLLCACQGPESPSATKGQQPDPVAGARLASVMAAGIAVEGDYMTTRDRLTARCMSKAGFNVGPSDPAPVTDGTGIGLTLEQAQVHGYGLDPREQPASPSTSPSADSWTTTSDDYKQRYTLAEMGPDKDLVTYTFPGGVVSSPGRGCLADTDKLMAGSAINFLKVTWVANNEVGGAVRTMKSQDGDLTTAQAGWSRCMSDAGHPAKDPEDARAQIRSRYYAGGPSLYDNVRAVEIAVATADVGCVRSSGLGAADRAAAARAAAVVYPPHEADIVAWQQLMAQGTTRGQRALSAS